jgi:HSP20 family molecular chaperone IbpA
MSFWNINIDDWIRGRIYLDENISAYMFHTTAWYGNNNSSYNRHSEFNDIIESYDADLREKDLLEEFRDIIPHHSIQEWPQELMIKKYQTISEEQTYLEPFIPHYNYINALPKVSGKEKRKKKRKFKKSPKSHLNSYANDDVITYAYHDSDILYSEDNEVVKEERDYPIEITRSNDLIRITTQTPFVDDKNNIKVKIYDDNSIEISIDDVHLLQSNKKYYRIVEVPKDADIETARCTYRNGVMEITFKQKNTVSD